MGRTVIITGTNRGIGKAILERFAREEGITILAHARKETEEFLFLVEEQKKTNPDAEIVPVYFDLANPDELKESLGQALRTYKKIDALVNNAGVVMPSKSFLMMDDQTLRTSFEVNFFAQVKITQIVCRAMIRNKAGSIVNMASVAAFSGLEGQFEYVSGKAAVIGMTRRLANELAPYHIRVNAVAPGLIQTDMIMQMEDGMRQGLVGKSVAGRLANPSEVSDAVYYLSGNEASFINGQCLIVNGGGYNI